MTTRLFFTLCVLWLAAQPAQAGLHILADYGGEPVNGLYDGLNRETPLTPQPEASASSALSAAGFPVRTPEMTSGDVPPRAFQAPGITPLFLVGDDPRSQAWLTENADTLKRLGATGMVVNVDSAQRLAALQVLVPGVILIPTAGSDIARRLQLTRYPVIITSSGLSGRITTW